MYLETINLYNCVLRHSEHVVDKLLENQKEQQEMKNKVQRMVHFTVSFGKHQASRGQ